MPPQPSSPHLSFSQKSAEKNALIRTQLMAFGIGVAAMAALLMLLAA